LTNFWDYGILFETDIAVRAVRKQVSGTFAAHRIHFELRWAFLQGICYQDSEVNQNG